MNNDNNIRNYCDKVYTEVYEREKKLNIGNPKSESIAQKEAIKQATMDGMRHYPGVEAETIWRAVYESHVHRKSGIRDSETIGKVISADQSWKKSSGHAFEEMLKLLGTNTLSEDGIEIILQRDLNTLVKAKEIANEPRDISWLKEQIKSSVFDLYAIVRKNGKKFCFGCIQSKTSIRDRVTRDREPSIQAMKSFFWSTVIVLDGEFLKLPKFTSMVNGGTPEYPCNGWHGMYVFSDKYSGGRIYSTDLDFKNFKTHAVLAADYWLTQRQWFNESWNVDNSLPSVK